MKIDSMDASSISFTKLQDTRNTKPDTKDDKNTSQVNSILFENLNISQLTNYEKKEMPVAEKVVIDAIEKANKAIVGSNRRLEFSIHEKTKQIMVKVIDSESNEVVREIPPEKTLDMIAKMWEMAGFMVDERR